MDGQNKQSNYRLLIEKLETFSLRYYKNSLIRGSIFFIALFMAAFLILAVTEYFGHFTTTARTVMFYSFLLVNIAALYVWVLDPLLQLLKIKQGLSYHQAARMIGNHFPEIQDKLLNTLQLKDQISEGGASRELIEASINQRIENLKPLPFTRAIDFKANLKYVKYAALPLAVILFTYVAAPEAIFDSTNRIIDHRTHFERPAPFTFTLKNDSLKAVRNQEFPLNLRLDGDQIPGEVYLELNGNRHKMQQENVREFRYRIRNPRSTSTFRFYANGYYSKTYELEVYPRPALEGFLVYLDYPAYTGLEPEEKNNIGDFTVPEGTEITWRFTTRDVDELLLAFDDTSLALKPEKGRDFLYSRQVFEDENYAVRTSNEYFTSEDSLQYFIDVKKDQRPQITVEKQQDEENLKMFYFRGEIADDYGFTSLNFNYRILNERSGSNVPPERESISIESGKNIQSFYHFLDMDRLNIQQGDQVEFYFTVRDNDAINGPKATRSETFYFRAPTRREMADESRQTRQEVEHSMDEAIKEMSRLRQEMQEIERNLFGKDRLEWQDKRQLEDMMKQYEQVRNQLEQMQEQFRQQQSQQQQFRESDPQMQERQDRMQELMDEFMDDDKRKLLEELQKALDDEQKERIQRALRELEQQERHSEREMERLKELFKQLDFEQQLRENIEQLEELAQKQDELSEQAHDEGQTEEELSEKQDALNKEFEEFRKEMEELDKKNQELRQPKSLDDFGDQMDGIEEDMQESIEQLMEQDRSGAQQQQQQSRDKMQQMSEQMKSMQMQMDMDAVFVNYKSLRRILQNLLHFSFNQEELMEDFSEVREHNPRYVELGQKQSRQERYARLIEDSLYSLSMRLMQIGPIVNQEMNEIHYHLGQTLQNISDRRLGQVRRHQQFVMTSANNLAAMLSEILENLQEQMASQMEGDQMSQQMQDSGEPSMSRMQQLQEELNQRMEGLQNQGEGQDGDDQDGQEGGEGMDEEYARIAAEQEMLRRQLRELRERMQDETGDGGKDLEEIEEEMEKTEKDALNRNINQETLERQREITVRLLEYEEAERKQDQREERRAESPGEHEQVRPPEMEEFFRERASNIERLQTLPPQLNRYYREKAEEYFRNLSED